MEDETFHVHRLILSMNSPVFKAMFKSQFKEATANEIPLPGKNASGVLDFLKIIYGSRYIQEQAKITSKCFFFHHFSSPFFFSSFIRIINMKQIYKFVQPACSKANRGGLYNLQYNLAKIHQ